MDPLEQLYSLLQSEPPAWPIWQAPELGRPWLLGAGIEEIFSPPSREFRLVGAEERPATASLAGSVAEGTTLQLGRSSVSAFVTPAATSAIVFLRRGYPMDAAMPEFLSLDDFSSARTERQNVLDELRAGG